MHRRYNLLSQPGADAISTTARIKLWHIASDPSPSSVTLLHSQLMPRIVRCMGQMFLQSMQQRSIISTKPRSVKKETLKNMDYSNIEMITGFSTPSESQIQSSKNKMETTLPQRCLVAQPALLRMLLGMSLPEASVDSPNS